MTESECAALVPGTIIVKPKEGTYMVVSNDPNSRMIGISVLSELEGVMKYNSLQDATKL
jgi:hypothetical protein